jgi:hypothetical protein
MHLTLDEKTRRMATNTVCWLGTTSFTLVIGLTLTSGKSKSERRHKLLKSATTKLSHSERALKQFERCFYGFWHVTKHLFSCRVSFHSAFCFLCLACGNHAMPLHCLIICHLQSSCQQCSYHHLQVSGESLRRQRALPDISNGAWAVPGRPAGGPLWLVTFSA